jgi:16S rRNA processing protein RimM
MTKSDCFNLGYISRRVGNVGELAFVLDVDTPERYKTLKSVFVEINGSLVPFFIKKIALRANTATVTIEGIDTIAKAEELIKSSLYLPLNTVIDQTYGNIGVVEKILDFPQQAILQIKKDEHEILIPVKDEFIISIDRNAKQLTVHAPQGLIDIYMNPTDEKEEEQ